MINFKFYKHSPLLLLLVNQDNRDYEHVTCWRHLKAVPVINKKVKDFILT